MYFTFATDRVPHEAKSSFEEFVRTGRVTITKNPNSFRRFCTIKKPDDDHTVKAYFEKHFTYNKIPMPPEPPKFPISELPAHYTSFKIPKKSGGYRQIDAPDYELSSYLSKLKNYLENELCILTHDAAFAYVKQRSCPAAVKEHQKNNSKWFLKLDIKDFFGSHTLKYVMSAFERIYPTCYLLQDEEFHKAFETALSYGFLNGKLPQGTPLSPTLTNILMTPIDYEIQHMLWDKKNNYIYTRYADDMLISSKYNFMFKPIETAVKHILTEFHTPFKIKTEKTRYGSSAGSNWNLGIMLNKDNRMTIGHKENQRFRAAVFALCKDASNGINWSIEDKQELAGKIAYFKVVDPEYTNIVIKRYEQKFRAEIKDLLKTM